MVIVATLFETILLRTDWSFYRIITSEEKDSCVLDLCHGTSLSLTIQWFSIS